MIAERSSAAWQAPVPAEIEAATLYLRELLARDNSRTKGLAGDTAVEVAKELERLKWFLWRGNVFRAPQVVEDLEVDLDVEGSNDAKERRNSPSHGEERGRTVGF